MSNALFYIRDARVDAGKLHLRGDYIVPSTLEVNVPGDSSSSTTSTASPQIGIPGRFTVKWILPPKTSGFYSAVKNSAENMGYETVEHEDFSYPSR
jgi:hypothetical protein